MDRDQRWERIKRAYDAIVHGDGLRAPTAEAALARPTRAARTTSSWSRPSSTAWTARVRDGDVVIHFNFRADRARQLTHALADGDEFDGFDRGARPRDLLVVTLTEYEEGCRSRSPSRRSW